MDEIKEIVHNVIQHLSTKNQEEQERIHALWAKAVPGQGLNHTRVSEIQEKTIVVEVDTPAWLYQLNLQKPRLLAEIRKDLPEIRKIYFKIGKAP